MLTSGVATRKTVDLDFEDESESTVHVIVHDIKPPFLDGRTVFTKQLDPINPIRDLSSDMAVFSKKGSALVKEKREQAERAKAAAKLAALGGTALGNIMGVKDEEAEAEGTCLCPGHFDRPPDLDIHIVLLSLLNSKPKRRNGSVSQRAKKRITRVIRSLQPISRLPRESVISRKQGHSKNNASIFRLLHVEKN